jgi:thioredoxin-related protein
MKIYIIILFIAANSFHYSKGQSLYNNKLRWYTIKEVTELQKKEPRKIIIDMFTDWCGWCKKMDQETFGNPVIVAYVNKYYYPVKFNAESSDSVIFDGHTFINDSKGIHPTHQLALAFFQSIKQQVAYPTTLYLDENMKLITPWQGYIEAAQLEVLLHYIVDEKYKPTPFEEYQKTFVGKLSATKPNP